MRNGAFFSLSFGATKLHKDAQNSATKMLNTKYKQLLVLVATVCCALAIAVQCSVDINIISTRARNKAVPQQQQKKLFEIHPSALSAIQGDDPATVGYIWGLADVRF